MALREIKPGLRTIHNGSNGVAKAAISVPVGHELTVTDEVAAQLQVQASGAFKDGPAPEPVVDAPVVEAKPVKAAAKKAAASDSK